LADLLKIDIFKNTISVPALEFGDFQEESTASQALYLLDKVTNDKDLYEIIRNDLAKDNKILPLELQMIGLMIEDMRNQPFALRKIEGCRSLTQVKAKKYLEKTYLIQRYFIRHIHCTTDQNAAMAILYALSSEKTSVNRLDVDSLAKICHLNLESAEEIVTELSDSGLVKKDRGEYYLPHDYLSEKFYVLSGTQLDPLQRDNIRYFSDFLERQKLGKEQKRPETAKGITDVPKYKFPARIDLLFIGIYTLLFLRLLSPVVKVIPWNWLGDYLTSATEGHYVNLSLPFDLDYLPSFIASCISAWYVWRIHRNFILKIPDLKPLTVLFIICCFISIAAGMIIPHAWLVFASVAGALIAIRIRIRRSHCKIGSSLVLNNSPSKSLKQLTSFTLWSMLITCIIGSFMVYNFYLWPDGANYPKQLTIIEISLSILYFVFMAICCKKHTSKHIGSILLGLRDRS